MDTANDTVAERAAAGGSAVGSAHDSAKNRLQQTEQSTQALVQRPGCRHGPGHGQVLDSAAAYQAALQRRRTNHPALTDGLPRANDSPEGGPAHEHSKHPIRPDRDREETRHRVPRRAHRPAAAPATPWSPETRRPSFYWLHSIDDPSLALPVTAPWPFFADYEVRLSDDDAAPARARVARAGRDLLRRSRHQGSRSDFTINLRGPIVDQRRAPARPPDHQRGRRSTASASRCSRASSSRRSARDPGRPCRGYGGLTMLVITRRVRRARLPRRRDHHHGARDLRVERPPRHRRAQRGARSTGTRSGSRSRKRTGRGARAGQQRPHRHPPTDRQYQDRKEKPPCPFASRPTSRRSTRIATWSDTVEPALELDGEAVLGLPHQPGRRRRRRPRDLREAVRADQRPRPGPAQRPGRRLARADG